MTNIKIHVNHTRIVSKRVSRLSTRSKEHKYKDISLFEERLSDIQILLSNERTKLTKLLRAPRRSYFKSNFLGCSN